MRLLSLCKPLLLLALLAPAPSAWGETARLPQGLRPGEMAQVEAVVDGDTVRFQDGREARLVGIQAPKLPLGRKGFSEWPLAGEAKEALERLALGRKLKLYFGGAGQDRHGRILAHLANEEGAWLQGEMLRAGLARVYSFPDNRAAIPDLLRHEQAARTARRGIWALDFYRVRTPEELDSLIGTFQIVEGRVLRSARTKSDIYLNFAEDWRRDFTIRISARQHRMFQAAGLDPLLLDGRLVRVRGWLRRENGPLVEATHPEQIELLAD